MSACPNEILKQTGLEVTKLCRNTSHGASLFVRLNQEGDSWYLPKLHVADKKSITIYMYNTAAAEDAKGFRKVTIAPVHSFKYLDILVDKYKLPPILKRAGTREWLSQRSETHRRHPFRFQCWYLDCTKIGNTAYTSWVVDQVLDQRNMEQRPVHLMFSIPSQIIDESGQQSRLKTLPQNEIRGIKI